MNAINIDPWWCIMMHDDPWDSRYVEIKQLESMASRVALWLHWAHRFQGLAESCRKAFRLHLSWRHIFILISYWFHIDFIVMSYMYFLVMSYTCHMIHRWATLAWVCLGLKNWSEDVGIWCDISRCWAPPPPEVLTNFGPGTWQMWHPPDQRWHRVYSFGM